MLISLTNKPLLGYNSYMLEYDTPGDNFTIQMFQLVEISTTKILFKPKGYNGKFTANFSGAYEDKLYVGMNLNFHFTDYVRTTSLYESNNNPLYSSGTTRILAIGSF